MGWLPWLVAAAAAVAAVLVWAINESGHRDPMHALARLDEQVAAGKQPLAAEPAAVFGTPRARRIGVDLFAGLGLLALGLALLRMRSLDAVQQGHAQDLQDERRRLQGLLQLRTADLHELASHLQTVRVDECSRLARELDAVLGALLAATQQEVLRLQDALAGTSPEVQARLEHLAQTLASGSSLKQRIVNGLSPVSLSTLGLVPALELLTREFAERAGVPVQTELQALGMPDAAQITAYRLVQEALTNVARHAQAQGVVVLLRAQGRQACVAVHDDGLGFDPDAPRHSAHGLLGMRARVQAAGGVLEIRSAPGGGTCIAASLPMLAAAAAP
jgi:signal transduction histidine kinase